MKFRKRPAMVEAVRFTGSHVVRETPWLARAFDQRELWPEPGTARFSPDHDAIEISNTTGICIAMIGDVIVLGSSGEMHASKPDVFERAYEAVPSSAMHTYGASRALKDES